MARPKLVTICQSGGEFVTSNDGMMSYSGGEAHAVEVDRDTTLGDFRAEISSIFNCSADNFSIKYFHPRNKRTLITVSNDKDLERMVDFHADSITADVYLLKKAKDRIIRSVVADSGTPTDATNATIASLEDAKRRKVCTAGWDNMITGVGQVFDGPKAFRDALQKYAIAHSFTYKFVKNDAVRVTAECNAEDCPWRIHASRSSAQQDFTIKKINDSHTCGKEIGKEGHRASQRWVASVIKDRLRDTPNYRPREIAIDLHREFGLSLNYSQAWRGKFVAEKELHNSHEEACSQLPWFCERIIETNPGSVATLEISGDSKFQLFIAFHASLSGYENGCRPLLFLDGIPLKVSKQWKILAATAVDGENEMFPVAFSIADAESKENWHWFLAQLKTALSVTRAVTFVSHRQNGLEQLVDEVFEDSHHAYCVDRLIEDFKAELDDSWTSEVKNSVADAFAGSIYACKVDEFNECIERIRNESKELAEWVLSTKPEHWSNAFFKGLRLGHYSSNATETYNKWISSRNEPTVVQMIDMIRCRMMEMIYARRESSNSWTETLTPSPTQRLQEELSRAHAHALNVICSAGNVFEVRDSSINIVNIETWECTCRGWQVCGLPCMHALSVLERIGLCIYDCCSKYFTKVSYRTTYALSINPIPDTGRPACMDPVHSAGTCPSRTRRQAGRPKLKPADPRVAIKRAVRCSRCKEYGHNKQTCKAND